MFILKWWKIIPLNKRWLQFTAQNQKIGFRLRHSCFAIPELLPVSPAVTEVIFEATTKIFISLFLPATLSNVLYKHSFTANMLFLSLKQQLACNWHACPAANSGRSIWAGKAPELLTGCCWWKARALVAIETGSLLGDRTCRLNLRQVRKKKHCVTAVISAKLYWEKLLIWVKLWWSNMTFLVSWTSWSKSFTDYFNPIMINHIIQGFYMFKTKTLKLKGNVV